jgi:ribosome-associated protein
MTAEHVRDICCIRIPPELNYGDYIIIGTCSSKRHLNSCFFSINREYKKFTNHDSLKVNLKSEGDNSHWSVIDSGRIIVHLFLSESRSFYDLESLWTCGSQFDEKYIDFIEHQKQMQKRLIYVEPEK